MVFIPDSHRDLINANQTVALATRGADGFPPVTALWFLADENGNIKVSLNDARQKTKNMARDPDNRLLSRGPRAFRLGNPPPIGP